MSRISRDQGLRRISVLTRWVGVAGIAGAGLFAAVAAKAQPGRAAVTTPTVGTGVSPADPASGSQTPADNGLQAPTAAPQASSGPPAAVSGGS